MICSDDSISVGFGVLGGASFVATRAVLPAIDAARGVHLAAIASRSSTIDDRWGSCAVGGYEDVLTHSDVTAVYLPLPNDQHEEWTIKAAEAGKHVLCEKPLAADATSAGRMVDACRDRGVLLAEAWMTPFDARWQRMVEAVQAGTIGRPDRIDARFTFTIGPHAAHNYRWDPAQGGGALLDVGIYTLGLPTSLWGAEPERIVVTERRFGGRGVDVITRADLMWPDDRRASVHCSFVEDEQQRLSIVGSGGAITVTNNAFTGGSQATGFHVDDGVGRNVTGPANDPYRAMIEAFTDAVRGTDPWPRPVGQAVDLLRLLDRIADQDANRA